MNCPQNCGACVVPQCGDGDCNGVEDCASCADDCGACPVCGDGSCNGVEDCASCADDCGACPVCGDAACDADETCASCADDCGACPAATCGDLVCATGETCAACPSDCGPCATQCTLDGICAGATGVETCTSCAADCAVNDAATCGDGECEGAESSTTCAGDCGPSPWPSTWAAWEAEVVTRMNAERAAGTDCASGAKAPVGALVMETALQRASQLHSWDQAYADYFAHTSCNGRSPWDRAAALSTSASSENIAWGYSSPAAAVAGWMASTQGHCDAIMDGTFTVVGVGYARASNHLWTAMFR